MSRSRRVAVFAASAGLLAVGCAGSETVSDTGPTTTVAPDPPTTLAPTTVASTTSTSTSQPATTTTTVIATTAETTETTETSTTTLVIADTTTTSIAEPSPPVALPATAYVTAGDLLEVDVASGQTLRTVLELFEEGGVFRGGIRLSPDGESLWFFEGYEDGWYACESSVGSVGRLDPATGTIELVAIGAAPELSADGAFVAYLGSDVCVPDPAEPEIWVLTPSDRVVVRTIATGDEREFVTSPPPEDYDSPSQVVWAGFSPAGNLLALTADGQLRAVDLDGSANLQDHPVVLTDVDGEPVVATADELIVNVLGDEGSADLVAIDATTGARRPLASSERPIAVGVDESTGQLLVFGFSEIVVEPGAPVTVLTVPDGVFVGSLDW